MKKFPAFYQIFVAALLVIFSGFAAANESFWQQPQAATVSKQSQLSLLADDDLTAQLTSSNHLDLDGRRKSQTSVSLLQNLNESTSIGFSYTGTDGNRGFRRDAEERNFVLGLTHNDLSVSYLSGSGEDYSSLAGDYTGVDPYLFHGGFKQDFKVSGYALDYGFSRFGHLQFGEAKVQANGLRDRRARYMEWSNSKMFARATRFSRGGDDIGNGFDVGYAFGNKMIAVQAMELENNRSLQRIRLQLNGSKSKQYWLDFSAHQNPLFQANDDYRVMFNFRSLLGTKHLASYQNDEVSSGGIGGEDSEEEAIEDENGTAAGNTKKKKGRGWKRAVFIGAGIAAAAGLSSSGSAMQDNNTRSRSQNEAAFVVLNDINPTSVAQNREFGGWVFVNPDGSFSSTAPVRGEAASVTLPNPALVIPGGSRITASYHTHGAFDPRFDNENFSQTDLNADRANMIDGYLATPGGQFKLHIFATDEIVTLGRIATE